MQKPTHTHKYVDSHKVLLSPIYKKVRCVVCGKEKLVNTITIDEDM